MNVREVIRSEEMLSGLNDVPKPWPKAAGLGLQHVLTMFGAIGRGAADPRPGDGHGRPATRDPRQLRR